MTQEQPLKIELKEWHYQCSDGCCDLYGTKIFVNGEEVEHYDKDTSNQYIGDDVQEALKSVLKHLGIECEIEKNYIE